MKEENIKRDRSIPPRYGLGLLEFNRRGNRTCRKQFSGRAPLLRASAHVACFQFSHFANSHNFGDFWPSKPTPPCFYAAPGARRGRAIFAKPTTACRVGNSTVALVQSTARPATPLLHAPLSPPRTLVRGVEQPSKAVGMRRLENKLESLHLAIIKRPRGGDGRDAAIEGEMLYFVWLFTADPFGPALGPRDDRQMATAP